MVHRRTSASFTTMALAIAMCLAPAAAMAAKGGGGNGGGRGGNLTAIDDSGSVAVGDSVTVSVLSNDRGGAKTVTAVTQGGTGTVEISADAKTVSYTPATALAVTYPYSVSFTYTMTNKKQSKEATGNVTITVNGPIVNNAPVAIADPAYSIDENITLSVSAPGVLGNDTDADNDPMTAVLDTNVSSGTLTLNQDGSFDYVPTADFFGSDSFTYFANDGTTNSATAATVTIDVTPVNVAPVANADPAYSTDENITLSVSAPGVLGNDTDADNDPLMAVLVTNVSSGTLTLNPDGSFDYVPNANFFGTDSFAYFANDGTTNSATSATVMITVNEVPDDPTQRLVPLTSWGETEVRHVVATFAYKGLLTDGQIATWAAMAPAAAINEILTFGVNNEKLSPIVDANATYCDSLFRLQDFWSSDDPSNIMRHDDRYRYAELSTNSTLSTSNLQRTWVKAINTRGCNPFLHKMALYFTNYHSAISAHKVRAALISDYYDEVVQQLVATGDFIDVTTAAATSAAVARAYGHQYNRFRSDGSFSGNDDFAREYFQLFYRILGTTEDPTYHEDTTIEHNAWLLTGMNLDQNTNAYGSTSSSDWYVSPLDFTNHVDDTGREINNERDHYNFYNNATCLEILHDTICGADAGAKIANLGLVAATHPESLANVPMTMIDFFADDNLDDQKALAIRGEWLATNFDILAFMRAYAISTVFHDPSTYKFKTAFDRNLEIQNANVLTNEGTFGRNHSDSPVYRMEAQGSEVFHPAHDVFGGQTGLQAANDRFLFKHAYEQNILNQTFIDDLDDEYTLSEGGPVLVWVKAWENVLPTNGNGDYVVADVATWLWNRFISDGGANFDPLALAQVQALLAQGRDFGYTVDPNDAERVFSSADISAAGNRERTRHQQCQCGDPDGLHVQWKRLCRSRGQLHNGAALRICPRRQLKWIVETF